MEFLVPSVLASFEDALGVVMEMADVVHHEQRPGRAATPVGSERRVRLFEDPADGLRGTSVFTAALLNDVGLVRRVAAFRGDGAGTHAARWLATLASDEAPLGALLLSAGTFRSAIPERSLVLYRALGQRLEQNGHRLIDWIESDGDAVRSYASLLHPISAWNSLRPP